VSGYFALSTLLQRYGSANYITVLREPLSRILSHCFIGVRRQRVTLHPLELGPTTCDKTRDHFRTFCPAMTSHLKSIM
jgi:hypothetical protein